MYKNLKTTMQKKMFLEKLRKTDLQNKRAKQHQIICEKLRNIDLRKAKEKRRQEHNTRHSRKHIRTVQRVLTNILYTSVYLVAGCCTKSQSFLYQVVGYKM